MMIAHNLPDYETYNLPDYDASYVLVSQLQRYPQRRLPGAGGL